MAIIYTYPPVTDPDGTELIVVSETKNKNSTRLITLAGICEFCDESTGCDHSFKYIQTSSLTPAEAIGCDQTLELISSDATVTITNVGNTIDFKTAGGGGGGCPPTYVIKPSDCVNGDCVISTKIAEWVWTCDEAIGALAPGYIDNLTLNGTSVPHPGGSTCWYIESATLVASATTCETCCPLETVYKLSPCYDGEIYYTTETLTSGIALLVGSTVLITTPEGTLCYVVAIGSGDPPIAVAIGFAVADCSAPECPTTTFSFVDCNDPFAFVTVDVDPGLVIGKVFTYCCESATELQTVKCWEYVGDVGRPVGGTFDPCINFGVIGLDSCDCCFNRCNYTYTACPGAPVGFPATLTFNLGMDPTSTCECNSQQTDIVVDDGAGNFWCYNSPEANCLPADEGYTILGVPANPCDDATYCPGSGATVYVRYDNCADPTGNKWASSVGTPGIESTTVGAIIKQGGTCYVVLENPATANPLTEIPGFIEYDPLVNCDCCEAGPNRRYVPCEGEELGIIIDPSAWGALNELSIDQSIMIEFGTAPGLWDCYEFNECTSDPATVGISDVALSVGCADPTCITFVQLTDCTGTYTEKVAASDFTPDILTLSPGDVINVTGGTLAGIGINTCWTVDSLDVIGPATQTGNTDWEGPIAGGFYAACVCCEYDLRTYDVCDVGDPCTATVASTLVLEMSSFGGTPPNDIVATEIASGNDCCYVLNEALPECVEITGTYVSTTTGCEDAACDTL